MGLKSHNKTESNPVFSADSSIFVPIVLLGILIAFSGLIGLYSIRGQQTYIDHVGLDLVPAMTLATEAETAMYMAVNAERGLFLVGSDNLQRERLSKDHATYIRLSKTRIADLEAHFEQRRKEHEDHHSGETVSNQPLMALVNSWSDASIQAALVAQQDDSGSEQMQFALFDSMITFTALNTRIRDMKHVIIDLFEDETSAELIVLKLSRLGLLGVTIFGLILSLLSIGFLRREINRLVRQLNHHVQRQDFTRQIGEALEMEDTTDGLNLITNRVLTELCRNNPAELLLSRPNQQLLKTAQNNVAGPAHCPVGNTLSCVAMRRGRATVFEDSTAINTCPHLADRSEKSVAAICTPVTFMGSGLGVVHTIYPTGELPTEGNREQLIVFSTQLAARLGTVNAFTHSQSLAITDPLTGLLNRRGLEQKALELASQTYCLAMIDLDFFKRLNDMHGHEKGDLALKTFANALTESLPKNALACRWGGEEFSVLIPGASCDQGYRNIVDVCAALAELLSVGDLPAFTASAGLADTTMAATFLRLTMLADQALYQAKADGRNRIVIASAPDDIPDKHEHPASENKKAA